MQTKHLSGKLKGSDHFEDLGFVRKIILKSILKKQGRDIDWIHLTQDKALW
jgi:hypothetical protein